MTACKYMLPLPDHIWNLEPNRTERASDPSRRSVFCLIDRLAAGPVGGGRVSFLSHPIPSRFLKNLHPAYTVGFGKYLLTHQPHTLHKFVCLPRHLFVSSHRQHLHDHSPVF